MADLFKEKGQLMRIMALFEWPIRRQSLDADAHADRVTMQRLAKMGWGADIFTYT